MIQIEQLGEALASLFSKLYRQRSQGKVPEAIEMADISFKSELGIGIDELYSIPIEQFAEKLQVTKKFNHSNFELLADILLLLADELNESNREKDKSLNLYAKSLNIYNYLKDSDLTYSIERQTKIERISSLINQR